jgi:hypothetical protein
MKGHKRIGRRRFLQGSTALVGAGSLLAGSDQSSPATAFGTPAESLTARVSNLQMQARFGPTQTVLILVGPESSSSEQLASRELARGLRNLGLVHAPREAERRTAEPRASDFVFHLEVDRHGFKHPEAYEIAQEERASRSFQVRIAGGTPQAVLYAVFDFLERQGAFFGLDGEIYPLEPAKALNLPPIHQPWREEPRFATRGLVPWPDFLNCITVFNREDLRAYLEAMVRMRFNTLGIHVYSGANQWVESFLSFEYAGAGHLAFTDEPLGLSARAHLALRHGRGGFL